MATSAFSVTITATAPSQPQADGLRLVGLRRFVRTNKGVIPSPGEGQPAVDISTMTLEELLPHAESALQRYIRDCIVADVAGDADAMKAAAVAQGEAQAAALAVTAEVTP